MSIKKPAPDKSEMAGTDTPDRANTNAKLDSLEEFRSDATGQALRTNQGVKIADNQNTLKAGPRGPSLLEDFIMREKITHFDHERIPERIVHARGTGAHGFFQTYENHAALTKAGFLQDPGKKTPVFVRFSTVQGPRGSGDTVRDVRGFAVKFFTDEGNFDLVGNNMPVFFIQDAIKFPDFVHAVKPEPHNEIPTGGSAHDTFWDFVSLVPESAHMVIWAMSDRAIPKSLRSMQGFGVHTFRLINAEGKSRFVKFHWRPTAGTCSLVWDEAQKLAGKDTDYHRRDLWEAIEMGDYPEWELGVQIVEEENEHDFDFDILDPTKIIPEEIVPITPLGKMTLNRNPDNFFAETEQVAFCPATLCRVSTSPMTRCCKVGCFPIPTRRSADSAGRTSMSCRSTVRWRRSTTASAMRNTAAPSTRGVPRTSRTRSTAVGQRNPASGTGRWFRELPGAHRCGEDPSAQRIVQRSLLPGPLVLQQHERPRKRAHHRCLQLRAGQGRT